MNRVAIYYLFSIRNRVKTILLLLILSLFRIHSFPFSLSIIAYTFYLSPLSQLVSLAISELFPSSHPAFQTFEIARTELPIKLAAAAIPQHAVEAQLS